MPAIAAPFQWLPQQQQQQQQHQQPMDITVTTAASNNSVTMTAMTPKKTQPLFIAVSNTQQQQHHHQQQQQQTTIDSFNEKHRDVEEHFKRSLALLHNSSSASSLPSSKDSTQVTANTVTTTQATSTPSQPTLFMPTIQSTQSTNNATSLQQQQIALVNNAATVYATQQQLKENPSEVSSHVANAEIAMPTPTKPQNVINNALNIENLIATSTSNPVTTQPTPVASSQVTFEPSAGHEQQPKSADVQVATTNPFPAIFLAPGGMYPQAAAATGLNYAPFISMDPNLLGTMLVSTSQLAAQANQAALLQQKLSNEDMIKMVQAQAPSSVVTTPAASTNTENNNDASNALMTMLLQRAGGVKPVYVVENSDGSHQLRSISGSNIIAMATTMDNGSTNNTSNSLSTQNSSSQIVPTPMNTDDSQVMETSQPATLERRSVHNSDVSSVSEQVEDHFARALGDNWQLTQKY